VTEREKNMSLGEYIEENEESWRLVDIWINGEQLLVGGRLLNYVKAWNDANFGEYFINTIIIAAMTVTGQTLFSIMAAYSFAQINFPGKDLIFGLFLAVLFVPASITNVPNFLMITQLDRLTGDVLPWTDNWPALVVPFLASTFGIFLLRQFFMQIPSELWDAAQIDGAGHLRFLFTIVVPISRAAIMTTVLFTFMGTWNALEWPLLVTKGDEWRPISFGLYAFQNEAGTQTHLLMAASVIALVPILIMYFIAQKQLTEGIQTTGLKG
jgi:ABC-type glycerol-3-phosphate transport system permease component